jgi:hypothetical protein
VIGIAWCARLTSSLFLEVQEIRCFQVNYEPHSGGPPIAGMLPAFRQIQTASQVHGDDGR